MTEPRRLGGVLALRETWCRPDETIQWCCEGARPRFDMPGVAPDGATGQAKAFNTAMNVADFLLSDNGSGDGPPAPPAVLATGLGPNCEAGRLAYAAAAEPGLWVLTSQRFAYVAPVPDPPPPSQPRGLLGKLQAKAESVRSFVTGGSAYTPGEPVPVRPQRSVFEIHSGQVTVLGPTVRRRPRFTVREPVFDKFVFADTSSLEFYTGPGGGLIPSTRLTTRLMPLTEEDK